MINLYYRLVKHLERIMDDKETKCLIFVGTKRAADDITRVSETSFEHKNDACCATTRLTLGDLVPAARWVSCACSSWRQGAKRT